MMLNQKQIEQAGKEEYAMWRKTKDRVNSITEFMSANATTHIERFDNAVKSGDPASMLDVFGPGGGLVGRVRGTAKALKNRASAYNRSHTKWSGTKKGPKPDYTPKAKQSTHSASQPGAAAVMDQLRFDKHIDILEYFRPVQTKAQMAAAVNTLKHKFSNYDKIIHGIGKNNYNAVQEGIYGGLEKGLAGKQMNQHSQWARELYIEKMRGLGTPGF